MSSAIRAKKDDNLYVMDEELGTFRVFRGNNVQSREQNKELRNEKQRLREIKQRIIELSVRRKILNDRLISSVPQRPQEKALNKDLLEDNDLESHRLKNLLDPELVINIPPQIQVNTPQPPVSNVFLFPNENIGPREFQGPFELNVVKSPGDPGIRGKDKDLIYPRGSSEENPDFFILPNENIGPREFQGPFELNVVKSPGDPGIRGKDKDLIYPRGSSEENPDFFMLPNENIGPREFQGPFELNVVKSPGDPGIRGKDKDLIYPRGSSEENPDFFMLPNKNIDPQELKRVFELFKGAGRTHVSTKELSETIYSHRGKAGVGQPQHTEERVFPPQEPAVIPPRMEENPDFFMLPNKNIDPQELKRVFELFKGAGRTHVSTKELSEAIYSHRGKAGVGQPQHTEERVFPPQEPAVIPPRMEESSLSKKVLKEKLKLKRQVKSPYENQKIIANKKFKISIERFRQKEIKKAIDFIEQGEMSPEIPYVPARGRRSDVRVYTDLRIGGRYVFAQNRSTSENSFYYMLDESGREMTDAVYTYVQEEGFKFSHFLSDRD